MAITSIKTHSKLERFRSQYRSQIKANYRGRAHLTWVFFVGIMVIAAALSGIESIKPWQLLSIPLTLVLANLIEYLAHRYLGHKKTKVGQLFYHRHTLEHHQFFSPGRMDYNTSRDWRVILFPIYLIVAISLCGIAPLLMAGLFFADTLANISGVSAHSVFNISCLMSITAMSCYLSYEALHFSYHLPINNKIYQTLNRNIIWRHLNHLHTLHHEPSLMGKKNFNVTLPLCDYLFGSLQNSH